MYIVIYYYKQYAGILCQLEIYLWNYIKKQESESNLIYWCGLILISEFS